MKKTNKVLVRFFLICMTLASTSFNTASAQSSSNDLANLSPEMRTLLSMASYVGTGNYCWAFGVDFRELSNEIDTGFRKNVGNKSALHYLIWVNGYKAGGLGQIFSPSVSKFIDVTAEANQQGVCVEVYEQVLRISRMK